MKETIQRLQKLADRATKYNYPEDSNMGISISDIRVVLEFYERHKSESEQSNAPDITPEWDKINKRYNWVAIDEKGKEFAYTHKPFPENGKWMVCGLWDYTGRTINIVGIDWTKTLSKRPAKK